MNKQKNQTRYFSLQWHITAACENVCSHCYLKDSATYNSETSEVLSTKECINTMHNFTQFVKHLAIEHNIPLKPRINFTGGDPLLRSDLDKILEEASGNGIYMAMFGNPNHLHRETAQWLKVCGIKKYQPESKLDIL